MVNVSNVLGFVTGVVATSTISYLIYKKKTSEVVVYTYGEDDEPFVSDEDESEELNDKSVIPTKNEEEVQTRKVRYTKYSKKEVSDYEDVVESLGYSNEVHDDDVCLNPFVHVIPPSEFGEEEGYSIVELTFYKDHILAEEFDIVEDAEHIIGYDSLNHFGEYENDAVHVRNDRMKCYYEILLDERTYEEALDSRKKLRRSDDDPNDETD